MKKIRTLLASAWMVVAAYILSAIVVIAVETANPIGPWQSVHKWFRQLGFLTAILPLLVIYVIWIIASLIFLDPWMVTIAVRLHPTYVNNIWLTRGSGSSIRPVPPCTCELHEHIHLHEHFRPYKNCGRSYCSTSRDTPANNRLR